MDQLKAAQGLVRTYSQPVADREFESFEALKSQISRVADLKRAFERAFVLTGPSRNEADVLNVLARVLEQARTSGARSSDDVCLATLSVLAHVFRPDFARKPWFLSDSRTLAVRAVTAEKERPRTPPVNATPAGASAGDGKRRVQSAWRSSDAPLGDRTINVRNATVAVEYKVPKPVATSTPPAPTANHIPSPVPSPANVPDPPTGTVSEAATVVAPPTPPWEVLLEHFVKRGLDWDSFFGAAAQLADSHGVWCARSSDPTATEALRTHLEATCKHGAEVLASLPASASLSTMGRESKELAARFPFEGDNQQEMFDTLRTCDGWPAIWEAAGMTDLCDAARLPEWIWPGLLPLEARRVRIQKLIGILVDPVLAGDLARCVEWIQGLDEEVRALVPTLRPYEGGAPRARLERALHELREGVTAHLIDLQTFLTEEASHRIRAEAAEAHEWKHLIERAQRMRARCADALPRLSADAGAELMRLGGSLHESADEVLEDIVFLSEQARPLDLRTITALATIGEIAGSLRRATQRTGPATPAEPPRTSVKLSHPMSPRGVIEAARLIWCAQDGVEYGGIVRVPLLLSIAAPPAGRSVYQLRVHAPHLEGRPASWLEAISPAEIGVDSATDGASKHIELIVPMPAKQVELGKPLAMTLVLTGDSLASPVSSRFEWPPVSPDVPERHVPFPDRVPDASNGILVGLEKRLSELKSVVSAGVQRFVICGPRRFGKSTLVRYLREWAEQELKETVVMTPVEASGKSPAHVWRIVGNALQSRFDRPWFPGDGPIPPPEAFDAIRREAWKQNIKVIYVIIDEAQALFLDPASRGPTSNQLKSSVEAWTLQSSSTGIASIMIGLVGQPHLKSLMSNNLRGAFPLAIEEHRFLPDDLIPHLRNASGNGLQSTAEAREALADLGANIFVLNQLFIRLQDQCLKKGRAWFVKADVERAAESLVDDFLRGEDTVWSYVRELMNESDDRDDWQPSEHYAVAIGWARALSDGVGDKKSKLERTMQLLQAWSQRGSGRGIVLEDRVSTSLDELKTRGVLGPTYRFLSPMLERFLNIRAHEELTFTDVNEQAALERLCLPAVRRPADPANGEGLEGGQARLYFAPFDDTQVTVRCVPLVDHDARATFLRELEVLKKLESLRSTTMTRDVQSFLPRVRQAGIDAEDENLGVVIYDFVPGRPLEEHSLSELAAVQVGRALSGVLLAFTQKNIFHRDIKPSNIIFEQRTNRPVLIDFGISVASAPGANRTRVGSSGYIPPEVEREGWSALGDVYSLGMTLKKCLLDASIKTADLRYLIENMTLADPKKRPDPAQLHERFLTLSKELQIDEEMNRLSQEIWERAEKMPAAVRDIVRNETQLADLVACRAGIVARPERRLGKIAEFLEDVFNALVAQDSALSHAFEAAASYSPMQTRLRAACRITAHAAPSLKGFIAVGAKCDAVGLVRNGSAHPQDFDKNWRHACDVLEKEHARGRRPAGRASDLPYQIAQLRQAILTVSGELDRFHQSREISGFVQSFVD